MTARIPLEPIQEPPYSAIPYEPGTMSAPANEEALRQALKGIELGEYDEHILKWMTLWESATVATICSWLYRKEAAARG